MSQFNSMQLIISKPEKLKPIHKLSELTITMVFWMFVFYLWQPLISLIAWSFGVKWYYQHMIQLGGSEHLMSTMLTYMVIISILGGLLVFWALSNKFRFRGKSRRNDNPDIQASQVAEHFRISHKHLATMMKADNISLNISQSFDITSNINHRLPHKTSIQ